VFLCPCNQVSAPDRDYSGQGAVRRFLSEGLLRGATALSFGETAQLGDDSAKVSGSAASRGFWVCGEAPLP